ncbi:MAG: enoyl-CoA hydratase/isomerase family protein [Pseudomonadota bacterium]
MPWQTLHLTHQSHVATVTLNRPEVRNAFNADSIAELRQVFTLLGQDEAVRAIVLAANGKAFCAGADLQWMQQMAQFSAEENHADAVRLATMLQTIYLCPKPVVAKVQGDCVGGGVGLIAACDIVLAADTAHFCLAEVKLGLIPATIAPYVIRAMGQQAARRYFLTAERFSAQEAYRIGLLHEVVAAQSLAASVDGVVQALAANGPQALRQAKALVREMAGRAITDEVMADTAKQIAQIRASDEGREGVNAFLEKRKPAWVI